VYQALERDEGKRRIWMEETFPAIKKRAEAEGAKIFFADEAGCRTDHHSGRTWSPVGQTPVVRNLGKHESIGMASAISMRGAMFWMTFDGTMNSSLFTEFLDLLLHDIDGKIFLIVDNADITHPGRLRLIPPRLPVVRGVPVRAGACSVRRPRSGGCHGVPDQAIGAGHGERRAGWAREAGP
jgi:hypothetical protein